MRSVFFVPPLARMSGGLVTLYGVARTLAELGHTVALTSPGDAAGLRESQMPRVPWEHPGLGPGDLWCVPESWPNALAAGAAAGARSLVYAQSWNFLLTTLPPEVRWKQLPARYLAVSGPVRWFMEEVLELSVADTLPPAVDPAFFREGALPNNRVRVAWMPRKNRALAEQIQRIALACLARQTDAPRVEWIPVQGVPQEEVARIFSTCHIFLATAFPEGFGLPPLEAMAAGCVPIGFTGFGGWEYMRGASGAPPCPLPEKPWGSNGIFVADGDLMAAGLALAQGVSLAFHREPAWIHMREAGRVTAAFYTQEARKERLARLWPKLLSG